MIVFETLRWKNFLSTGNIFTEIKFNENKTTLIVGENGSGKSTMLDALSFGLFGKAFRKINKPQLLNSITQKNMVVEIEFSIGSNKYKIIRGIKPAIFEVYQNESLLNQSAEMKDYQDILEKHIIKVNHKSFCQVVILGSATFQPFMQLTTGQRREIVEDLLDLEIFTKMNSLLKDKVLENNEAITKVNTNKKIIEEKIKLTKEHLSKIQNNNEQLIEDKKLRIADTDKQISGLKTELENYVKLVENLSEQVRDHDSLKTKIKNLESIQHKIEANRDHIRKDLDFFHKNDDCPVCKQIIDKAFKAEVVKEKNSKLEDIDDGLSKLMTQYTELQEKISDILKINDQINDNKMSMHQIKTQIISLNDYKDTLENEIKNLKKIEANDEGDKIKEYEDQLEDSKTEYNNLVEEKNVLGVAALMLKDGGIKSRIIKQYVPVFNKLINKYLSNMEFMCQFELDETFKETIKSRYRDEFSYESFSEGEKVRINLAILFTWRAIAKLRNSINTNILIMDEVFDSSLDSNGMDEFLKIINDITSETNVFIISHKTDQLYDKFDKVIQFKKVKNFSRIT